MTALKEALEMLISSNMDIIKSGQDPMPHLMIIVEGMRDVPVIMPLNPYMANQTTEELGTILRRMLRHENIDFVSTMAVGGALKVPTSETPDVKTAGELIDFVRSLPPEKRAQYQQKVLVFTVQKPSGESMMAVVQMIDGEEPEFGEPDYLEGITPVVDVFSK